MDTSRFDGLARTLGAEQSRRSALRVAGVGLVAGLVPGLVQTTHSGAAELSSEICSPVGTKCGRRRNGKRRDGKPRAPQPACSKCCTRSTTKQRNGQRRCTCVPDLVECRRDDQCCSGLCLKIEDHCGCPPEEVPEEFPTGTKVCIPAWLVEGFFGV